MTAETDLLPLPAYDIDTVNHASVRLRGYTSDRTRTYARANVAHRTAAQAAEIEALRAERQAWFDQARKQADLCRSAEARAERLAEALRLYMAAGFGNSTDFYKQAEAQRAAHAALHPTAAQEAES